MFRCDKIDIVHLPDFLEFDHPDTKLFWSQVESFLLMSNIMVLAENASQIAPREEYAPAAVVALDTGLLTEMRPDDIDLDSFGAYEAISRLLIPVDTA
jgi:hypothetical protein